MTGREATKIVRILQSTYPSYKPSSIDDAIDVWTIMFKDTPFELVSASVYAYISQDHEFACNPGQIKQIIADMQNKYVSETDAWNMVAKALRNGIYGAEEEFEKLPPEVQQAVGSPEWIRDLASTDVNLSVESSNFYKRYRMVVERRKLDDALPSNVKNYLASVNQSLIGASV